MVRPHQVFAVVWVTMCMTPYASCQVSADAPTSFMPAADAEVVKLDQPHRQLALPTPGESPRGPGHSFPLDPSWHIARVAITEDGQIAYLLVFEADQKEQPKRPRNVNVSIRRISLDTGEETARYDLPAPFDTTRYPSAWGNGDAGLTVSASGQSLIAAFLPLNLMITNEADQKYKQAMTFFRWDTQTKERTDERLIQPGAAQWKMLLGDDRLILWKHGQGTIQIECWDANDLSVTPWVEFPRCPTGQPRRDGVIYIWRDCIAYDDVNKKLNVMLHWRRRPADDRPFAWEDWLQQFDTETGLPTGPGTKFENVHEVSPVTLQGDHLLLHEQDRSGLDHRQTAHVWNIPNREHVASIDITPASKTHGGYRVNLTPDGSAVIYENRLLDLRMFTWSPARAGTEAGAFSAITPDGQRKIVVKNTTNFLEVYDLNRRSSIPDP